MRRRWAAVALVAATVIGGCAEEADPAPAVMATGAPHLSAPELIDGAVTWPDAAADESARALLPAEARLALERASMPVLVAAPPELLEVSALVVRDRFYAQSARQGGLTASVHGTRTSHRYPAIGPARGGDSVRGQAAFVTQNEGIWSAAWIEGGVAYSVEVECSDRTDARCADGRYVRELADTVRFVGPQQEQRREGGR